ncbi:MAG: tRNA (adenosine(37)-N6)-threonylcarbamoyltransferase complex transferase subunit TsaD [Candidatus Woesearchaeota archaeon]|nr:MAG: tRNA (adenosine(37)-N6)-threonylcarbamoyltransferase complex transferase subunit TsaD [Candidatus Woesearchaeota archaeon]
MVIILGIESTAHTFGAALLDGETFLSNVKDSFTSEEEGMIPAAVADHHIRVLSDVLSKALQGRTDIEVIAYSASPGLGHTLRIGAAAARALAKKFGAKLVGVNHCIAHLEIGKKETTAKDPVFLYASGVNTQVIAFHEGKFRIFGETLDMGVGNFLDSFGRKKGLGFPAGPKIEALAKKGTKLIDLPYSVKGMDTSFGGLLTKIETLNEPLEDVCYSVQETVFAMLVEVCERALAFTGKNELLLGGGVACNKRLQDMCSSMCKARGAIFHVPANEFLVDNAAMIAWLGKVTYEKGNTVSIEQAGINPYERTDEV